MRVHVVQVAYGDDEPVVERVARVADLVAGRDPFAHGPPPLAPMSRSAVPALAPGVTYERPLPRQTGTLRRDHLGRDHLGPVLIGGIQTPDDVDR